VPGILSCPTCAAVVVPQEAGGFCPQCRTPLSQSDIETMMPQDLKAGGSTDPRGSKDSGTTGSKDTRSTGGWLSSSGAIDHGRFEPGTLLGGRYRVIERRGRGGMGEVYRADDLKLGQPVALKFLPSEVDRDPALLTQLHTEVRMARQVSHPNVCRVYDIDEIDGHTFLSMEYVDGEDLASLLRRVGRFPEDRALEIARQICAGIAAAHERGVVHRDLKPANVMLDGTGKVRVTDFGLAGIAGESIRAGTPAYMAPEQLAGGEVTPQSDIYSLGLVLYEVFTGQRALEGKNLAELIHKREQSGILPPTAIVKSLDPKIELAIMRCLKPQIGERPATALAVAAALPGGDPLAAALAAGETPSPEMVAAAGTTDALHPAVGVALVAAIVAGLVTYAAIADRKLLYPHVPMQRSLDSLDDRAREILGSLGYPSRPTDTARGLAVNSDLIRHIATTNQSANRWDSLSGAGPVMLFWHRSSPSTLVPVGGSWSPTFTDPPMTVVGMTRLRLDDAGRLVELEAIPPRMENKVVTPAPWPALFSAAGLDIAKFTPAAPLWVPRAHSSERAAWEGPYRDGSDIKVRVEAGAFGGLPVFFQLTGPWTPEEQTAAAAPRPRFWQQASNVLGTILLLTTLLLARSNLRAGRGDRRGAGRLFIFTIAVWVAAWIASARHYSSFQIEDDQFFLFLGPVLMNAGIVWLLYIALEPYVRRFSPGILISWTRLLAGQIIDPRVGRDLLAGVTVGVGVAILGLLFTFVHWLLGSPPSTPRVTSLQFLLGSPRAIGAILRMIPNAILSAMAVAVAFALGRALFKSTWGGALLAGAILMIFVLGEASGEFFIFTILFVAAFVVPLVGGLLYFGLLTVAVAFLTNQVINSAPMTLDPSMPHAPGALWAISVVLGLTLFGFYASRSGQPLFGRILN
jgi:serine/threonine-protein kinase